MAGVTWGATTKVLRGAWISVVNNQSSSRTTRLRYGLAAAVAAGLLASCGASSSVRSGGAVAIGGTTTEVPPSTEAPLTTDTVPVDTAAPASTEAPVTTEAPTTTVPLDCLDATNLPALVATESGGYDGVQSQEGLGATDERKFALFTAGGAVAVQAGSGSTRSIEYRIGPKGGGGPKGTIKNAVLFDLVLTKQGPAILYGKIDTAADPVVTNSVLMLDIGSGDSTPIAEVKTDSFSAQRGSAGNGAVVTSATDANGQVISTWAIDGKGPIERYSPAVTLDGTAQYFGWAVLSADGKKLAWLEGPNPTKKGSSRKGSWKLVIATADEGTESLRLTLGPASDNFVWLDWDGSWAVLSRGFDKPAVAIHTTEDSATPQNICNLERTALLTGMVTLVRHTTISTDSGIA